VPAAADIRSSNGNRNPSRPTGLLGVTAAASETAGGGGAEVDETGAGVVAAAGVGAGLGVGVRCEIVAPPV
jgi:hypothetical protein